MVHLGSFKAGHAHTYTLFTLFSPTSRLSGNIIVHIL